MGGGGIKIQMTPRVSSSSLSLKSRPPAQKHAFKRGHLAKNIRRKRLSPDPGLFVSEMFQSFFSQCRG